VHRQINHLGLRTCHLAFEWLMIVCICVHLEEDPVERRAMELMLKLIASDKSMSQIAADLNRQGLHTRNGSP
jgi:hypothetical protein